MSPAETKPTRSDLAQTANGLQAHAVKWHGLSLDRALAMTAAALATAHSEAHDYHRKGGHV